MNRRAVIVSVFFALLLLCGCSSPTRDQLVGTWEGTSSEGDYIQMIFNPDGTGKTGDRTKFREFKWSIDPSKNPMQLDVDFQDFSRFMIFRFLPDGKLQVHDGQERPTGFAKDNYFLQITLRKK